MITDFGAYTFLLKKILFIKNYINCEGNSEFLKAINHKK